VLLTHWHGDHTGGVPDILRLYPHLDSSIYKNDPEPGQQNISDGQRFRVKGATVRAVHAPGHSDDHMCFVLEEDEAMFTGDNVLGHGTSATEDLGTFTNSLQKMADQDCKTGYSAHGVVIDDLRSKLKGELRQKKRREQQVMGALERKSAEGVRSSSIHDVVSEIYGTTVDEKTRSLALEPFIGEVLKKLAADRKVAFETRAGKKKWFAVGGSRRNTGRSEQRSIRPMAQLIAA
jgi:glyoxylase-like metal-dependent hydrolase (beta-lactamase superfamily II)